MRRPAEERADETAAEVDRTGSAGSSSFGMAGCGSVTKIRQSTSISFGGPAPGEERGFEVVLEFGLGMPVSHLRKA